MNEERREGGEERRANQRWGTGFTVGRTKILFNNHGPINNPTFVKKVGTFFGMGTQLKRMK